jgi:hypothetical protein
MRSRFAKLPNSFLVEMRDPFAALRVTQIGHWQLRQALNPDDGFSGRSPHPAHGKSENLAEVSVFQKIMSFALCNNWLGAAADAGFRPGRN